MTWRIIHGDCLEVLPGLPENSIDTVITDPPYGLEFMGKDWDKGVPGARFWREIARVAKPGAMLMAFGGTRTHHRLMVAIEDAGWEIRDCIMWVYGSGFPKSHDISKGIDKAAGVEREVVRQYTRSLAMHPENEGVDNWRDKYTGIVDVTVPATPEAKQWDGWGTALKPAWEPIIVAMNPREGTFAENALAHGVAGLWVDGARIGTDDTRGKASKTALGLMDDDAWNPREVMAGSPRGRWPANVIFQHHPECVERGVKRVKGTGVAHRTESGGKTFGSDNDKPPMDDMTYADPDGLETIPDFDCHADCPVRLLGEQSGERGAFAPVRRGHNGASRGIYGDFAQKGDDGASFYGDTGTAVRFFYTPKASRKERTAGGKVENRHPTVKPLEILRYLVRLTKAPTGGVVLDPFMGSGTTGVACVEEGRNFIGIEIDKGYCEIAEKRIREAELQMRLL